MRTYTITRTVYSFDELTPEAQNNAVEKLWDLNVDYDWWENVYEDAANIGLGITGFDLNRGRHAEGKFLKAPHVVAAEIIESHGPTCQTRQSAIEYQARYMQSLIENEDPDWGSRYNRYR